MRIRIALIAAMTAAFVMSIMTSFSTNPAVAEAATARHGLSTHRVVAHSLAAFSRADQPTPTFFVGLRAWSLHAANRPGAGFPTAGLSSELRQRTGLAAAAITTLDPPPPPPPPTDATSTDTPDWQCIRIEESGDQYNNPAAPSGAYGILEVTWLSNGYSGWPYQASATTQNALALKLYNEFGWTPWSSRFACGL